MSIIKIESSWFYQPIKNGSTHLLYIFGTALVELVNGILITLSMFLFNRFSAEYFSQLYTRSQVGAGN